MAKKRIDVEIGVKNKVAAGLKQAKASIASFGQTAGNILRNLTRATMVLGAATVAFGVKSVKAFFAQESAEMALAEAMRAHGDAVDELLPKHKALAASIQNETGIADESTLATMAKLRTLGVTNNEMEKAIKLTLALGKTGMREKTAFRAAADALNGNTTALTTYIPELRQATTQAEKMAVVNDLMVRGYDQLKGELHTNAGRWIELKGRIGDFMEAVGRTIVQNASFQDVLKKLSDRIKTLTESGDIDRWASKAVEAIKQLGRGLKIALEIIKEIIASRFEIMWIAVAAAIGIAAVKTTRFAVELTAIIVKSVAAAGGIAKLTAAMLTLKAIGIAGVFTASAAAAAKLAKTIWETHRATMAVIKSQKALNEMEAASKKEFGTRSAATMRQVRQIMQTGTDEEKASAERMFPKLVAAWKKNSGAPATPAVMTAAKLGPGNGGTAKIGPAISADTSMLSSGDLFTMMQAGTGAKRDSELSELQTINSNLEKLIDVSGGVE